MKRMAAALSIGLLASSPVRSDEAAPPSRALATAELLAAADAAADRRGRTGRRDLGKAVVKLERIGARAQDGQEDVVADWRDLAGAAATGPAYRGRVLGPAYRRGWLEPGAELKVEQLFLGGQAANVAVAATPDQPLHLTVQGADAAARCGASARDCRWVPIFTERYTIRVRNGGSARARYYLVFD